MRLSRVISARSWGYAIGEIFLIVVGVSLALMANSWYEDRNERREELRVLQQLKSAIESDLSDFSAFRERLEQSERDLLVLYDALDPDHPITADIAPDLQQVTIWRSHEFRTGPYEEIRNRGFSLLSNTSLRTALIDLYERKIAAVQIVSDADIAFSSDQVTPYFNANLVRELNGSWTPIDGYASLQGDTVLRNLVALKIFRLQRYFLPVSEDFSATAQGLLAQIELEVDRLER